MLANLLQKSWESLSQQSENALCVALAPPEDLNIWEWAEAKRVLARSVTSDPGRYSTADAAYQKEPQEAFLDPEVQTTVLWWASRLGKTEMLNNLEGYIIEQDPSSILVVYPTLDSAQKWSKKFFSPMVEATPCLRARINTRSRVADNTILEKKFPGGTISAIGANSPSGFRQIQARCVICDEIDAMEDGSEGDPITLAFKRADNYSNSIQVLSSTATIKGASRIEKWYNMSDRRQYWVPCVRCGHEQLLVWPQVKWPKGEPELAVYECIKCCRGLNDVDRLEMIANGSWKAEAGFRGIRGYYLNGIYSPFATKKGFKHKLHQFAQEFLDANKGGREEMRVWVNTFKNETYEYEAETVEADPIFDRREEYKVPEQVVYVTGGADVQGDRIEAEKVGWGESEETWGLDYRIFEGNPIRPEVWEAYEKWLWEPIPHPSGHELLPTYTFVDSSAFTKNVYEFTRPRQMRGVFSVKGYSEPGKDIVERPKKSGRNRTHLIMVGTNTAKALIYSRLKLENHGPGFMHYNTTYDLEYFKQLTAEKGRTRFKMGQRYMVFEPHRERNEALDIRVYATAAYAYGRPNMEVLKKKFATAPVEREETKEPPKKPVARKRWANSWNRF